MVSATLVLASQLLTNPVPGPLALAGQDSAQTAPQVLNQSADSFNDDLAWKWLIKQCDLGPRFPGSPGHLKARDLLLEEMKLHCQDSYLQPFRWNWSKSKQPVSMWNIIGFQNWESAETRVVLLAHWDTRPSADEEPNPSNQKKPIIGANDGASGVAVLMELMRHTQKLSPKLGICYLLVDGEDLGPDLNEMFLGATHFAKNLDKMHPKVNKKPDYGILLDMIGDADLRVPVEPNSYEKAKSLTLALYRHAAEIGLSSTFPQELGPTIFDDHLALNDAGIPTIDLIDFDYPAWHTLGDTPEKCSAKSLGKIGKLLQTWLQKAKVWNPKKRN